MLKFYVKVFCVMSKALSGELFCPSDRSCYVIKYAKANICYRNAGFIHIIIEFEFALQGLMTLLHLHA